MKLRNKIFSALMAVVTTMSVACMSAFAADPSIALNPSATEVKAGDTITVDVVTANNPGVYYVQFNVSADPGLTLTGVTNGSIYAGPTFDKDYSKDVYSLTWFIDELAENNCDANGVAATLTYTVDANAKPGTYTINIADGGSDNIDFEGVDFGTASTTIKVVGDTGANNYFSANFTAGGEKYNANKGMTFNFFSKKANDSAKYTWNFTEMFGDTVFQTETDVDVQIMVKDAPAADDLTITDFEWSATGRE